MVHFNFLFNFYPNINNLLYKEIKLDGKKLIIIVVISFIDRLWGWGLVNLMGIAKSMNKTHFLIFFPHTRIVHQFIYKKTICLLFINKQGVCIKSQCLQFRQIAWCFSATGVFECLVQNQEIVKSLIQQEMPFITAFF